MFVVPRVRHAALAGQSKPHSDRFEVGLGIMVPPLQTSGQSVGGPSDKREVAVSSLVVGRALWADGVVGVPHLLVLAVHALAILAAASDTQTFVETFLLKRHAVRTDPDT
jgi:hypothetical protein